MKKIISSMISIIFALALTWSVEARNTKLLLPIAVALAVKDAQDKLDGSIKFYLAIRKHRRL